MNLSTSSVRASLGDMLPSKSDYRGLGRSWHGDVLAGVTVGVVALPLALGFGIASGVGPTAGIITAIVAGVVAGVFGGSSVQISGPTGAMAVVLAPIVVRDGTTGVASLAVIADVLVLAMGIAGFGRFIQFVPWSVLEGFTLGIAITIILQQVPLLMGETKGTGTSVLDSAWLALTHASTSDAVSSLALAAGVVLIMLVWPRITTAVPSSIVAVVVVSAIAVILHTRVPVIGELPHHLPTPHLPSLGPSTLRRLFGPAVAVATLASIESLLSARVADAMTGRERSSDRREMIGQGLANVACGLFGGMPATGAIARTAVNVRSGAHTRLAAITHAAVILVIIVAAAPIVAKVPLAVLGGVLVMTALRMVDRVRVTRVLRAHASETVVFVLTALTTVVVDLITAIEVGLVVAGVLALRAVARDSGATQENLADLHDGPVDESRLLDEHIAIFRLDGALFFGAAPRFLESFAELHHVSVVILRLKGLTFIDASGAEALAQIIDDLDARGITVLVKGARAEHDAILATAGVLEELSAKGHLFDDLDAALAHARRHVARDEHADDAGEL